LCIPVFGLRFPVCALLFALFCLRFPVSGGSPGLPRLPGSTDVSRAQPLGADFRLDRYGMAATAVMAVRLGSVATAAASERSPYGWASATPLPRLPHASHR
jgi:hypothetical protein